MYVHVVSNSYLSTELVVNEQTFGALIPQNGVSNNDTGSTSVVIHVNGEDVYLRINILSPILKEYTVHSDTSG